MSLKTINVSNSQELYEALNNATGGETILLASGNYGNLSIWPGALKNSHGVYDSEVTIKSEDINNAAVLNKVSISGGQNITFDSLKFELNPNTELDTNTRTKLFSTGNWSPDSRNAENIAIKNSVFEGLPVDENHGGDALNHLDVYAHNGNVIGLPTGVAVGIRFTDGVVFENNEISGFHRGATFSQSTNLVVEDNYIHDLRSDGINFAEVKDVTIESNEIRDMTPWRHDSAVGKGDHGDLIQFWTASTNSPSEDIIIRRNLLHVSEGDASQSIFMRNEVVDRGQASEEMFYRNILIEDNVIYNAHSHGTTVGEVFDLVIQNNTYIQNVDKGSNANVTIPAINVSDRSEGVVIQNNIVPRITDLGKEGELAWVIQNNLLTQNRNENDINHVDSIFFDAQSGKNSFGADLQIIPGSQADLMGVGSRLSRWNPNPDQLTPVIQKTSGKFSGNDNAFTFDATYTADQSGFLDDDSTFLWDFGDGNTASGKIVNHVYDSHGHYTVQLTVKNAAGEVAQNYIDADILDPVLFRMDVNADGIHDVSSYDTSFSVNNLDQAIVELDDGTYAYRLNNNTTATLGRNEQHLYNHDQFAFNFDLQRSSPIDGGGYIFMWISSMRLTMNNNGYLKFEFWNLDEQHFQLISDVPIDDVNWTNVTLSYDANSEKAIFYINGEHAGETHMSGLSDVRESWGLQLGYDFKDNFEGLIKNFTFRSTEGGADSFDNSDQSDAREDYSENIVIPEVPVLDDPVHDQEIQLSVSDKIQGGSQLNDLFYGTISRDVVKGLSGDDVFHMGAGDDHVNAGSGDDVIYGGAGHDYIHGFGGYDTVYGGDGDDEIYGNLVFGEAGNDVIRGSENSDDYLSGGSGDDTIIGYGGKNVLYGGEGQDKLKGGDGDDVLVIDHLDTWVQGGGGTDTVLYESAEDYEVGVAFFHSIEKLNLKNSYDNDIFIDWGDLRAGDLFIFGDDGDDIIIDASWGNAVYTAQDIVVDGQAYTQYNAIAGNWLDVNVYIADNLDVALSLS